MQQLADYVVSLYINQQITYNKRKMEKSASISNKLIEEFFAQVYYSYTNRLFHYVPSDYNCLYLNSLLLNETVSSTSVFLNNADYISN